MEDNLHEFQTLALGTRFSYPDSDKIWVRIAEDRIALWSEDAKTISWIGQPICSFDDDDDLTKRVVVR